jgi:hypothetical protein
MFTYPYESIYLSVYLSVYLSIYLPTYIFMPTSLVICRGVEVEIHAFVTLAVGGGEW